MLGGVVRIRSAMRSPRLFGLSGSSLGSQLEVHSACTEPMTWGVIGSETDTIPSSGSPLGWLEMALKYMVSKSLLPLAPMAILRFSSIILGTWSMGTGVTLTSSRLLYPQSIQLMLIANCADSSWPLDGLPVAELSLCIPNLITMSSKSASDRDNCAKMKVGSSISSLWECWWPYSLIMMDFIWLTKVLDSE